MTKQGTIEWNLWTVTGEKTLVVHYELKSDGSNGIGDLIIESKDGTKPPELDDNTVAEIIGECIKDSMSQEEIQEAPEKFDFSKICKN